MILWLKLGVELMCRCLFGGLLCSLCMFLSVCVRCLMLGW